MVSQRFPTGCTKFLDWTRCNMSKMSECFIRGSKHRETYETVRLQAECFYCFEVFGTPQSRLKIQHIKACKITVLPAGMVKSS